MWRVPALLLIVVGAWWFWLADADDGSQWIEVDLDLALCSERWNGKQGCVVDGDTLIIGSGAKRRRVRLIGFDAPELNGACEAERERAIAARAALHRWISQGSFEWGGGVDSPRDRYGRELRSARRAVSEGRYETLEGVMIDARLASPTGWGEREIDWCR